MVAAALPLLGPSVVWNAGAPAWSVREVCPWVRLLWCGVGRPVAGGAGAVGVLEMALSAPPRSGSDGGGGDGPCQTEARRSVMRSRWMACGASSPIAVTSVKSGFAG